MCIHRAGTYHRCRCDAHYRVSTRFAGARYDIVTGIHTRSNTSFRDRDSLPFRVFYCFAKKPTGRSDQI